MAGEPDADRFWTVLSQSYWYVAHFWHEMGNSLYIGVGTAFSRWPSAR